MAEVNNLINLKIESLDAYNKALSEYKRRNFTKALSYFNDVLEIAPGDKVSLLYIERCKLYIKEPPSSDWDGVFIAETK